MAPARVCRAAPATDPDLKASEGANAGFDGRVRVGLNRRMPRIFYQRNYHQNRCPRDLGTGALGIVFY